MKKEAKTQKQKTKEIQLIPSDYIMSSLDIAEALNRDHKEVYELIEEYIGLGTFSDKGYLYPVFVRFKGVPTNVFLLDLEAVLDLAEDISSDDGSEVGRAILTRYFELARTGKILSSEIYMGVWSKIQLRQMESEAFAKRVMACIEANE